MMIEALRRLWGKVLRTPALPDQSPTGGGAIRPIIPQPYRVVWSSPSDITSRAPSPDTGSAPIPPSPPEPPRPTWAEYDQLMAGHQSYAGWTFCRFGVRGPRSEDHTDVMGIVRAPFGAWWAPFLCVDGNTGHQTVHGLACVEHTRSGMAIGVFGDMDVAVAAAEIASRLDDWNGFSINEAGSMQLVQRVRTAWDAAGIVHSPFTGYPTVRGKVPQGQGPIAIFIKNPMADLRPEQLS